MGFTDIEQRVANTTVAVNEAIIKHLTSIDLEQRRYEIAKEILPFTIEATPSGAADFAVQYADALIEKLKKSRTNDEE